MPTRTILTLILTIAVPLGLGACGGGDEDDHAGHDHAAHAAHAEPAPAVAAMEHAKMDAAGATRAFDSPPPIGEKGICPVSGEAYVVDETTEFSEHEGKHYGFCCPGCKPKFDADPASFLGGKVEG